jgi:8-oxo-dGTP pyrophosphatase MutT (NUDIX family)
MTENKIEKQKVSFKGIFRRGDKFLVLKEANDLWELPGGKLEFEEAIPDCFAREMSEELGWLKVKMGKIVYAWTLNSPAYKTQYIIICATAEPSDKPIKLSLEHLEYQWLTLTEIEKINIFPEFIEAIKLSIE